MNKEHKQYCTLSAIYRMLRKKLINPCDAQALLENRAGYSKSMAKSIKELWMQNHIMKQAWG